MRKDRVGSDGMPIALTQIRGDHRTAPLVNEITGALRSRPCTTVSVVRSLALAPDQMDGAQRLNVQEKAGKENSSGYPTSSR